jgi:hypothetical protein
MSVRNGELLSERLFKLANKRAPRQFVEFGTKTCLMLFPTFFSRVSTHLRKISGPLVETVWHVSRPPPITVLNLAPLHVSFSPTFVYTRLPHL